MTRRDRILQFLKEHQGTWHYGLDIAREAKVSRGSVYLLLGMLEDVGQVERRLEPQPCAPGYMRRTQYRITKSGLRDPVPIHLRGAFV